MNGWIIKPAKVFGYVQSDESAFLDRRTEFEAW